MDPCHEGYDLTESRDRVTSVKQPLRKNQAELTKKRGESQSFFFTATTLRVTASTRTTFSYRSC